MTTIEQMASAELHYWLITVRMKEEEQGKELAYRSSLETRCYQLRLGEQEGLMATKDEGLKLQILGLGHQWEIKTGNALQAFGCINVKQREEVSIYKITYGTGKCLT